jgi:hypothetical protein
MLAPRASRASARSSLETAAPFRMTSVRAAARMKRERSSCAERLGSGPESCKARWVALCAPSSSVACAPSISTSSTESAWRGHGKSTRSSHGAASATEVGECGSTTAQSPRNDTENSGVSSTTATLLPTALPSRDADRLTSRFATPKGLSRTSSSARRGSSLELTSSISASADLIWLPRSRRISRERSERRPWIASSRSLLNDASSTVSVAAHPGIGRSTRRPQWVA